MSSYYELPDIEPQHGTQAELERRLMSRVAQVRGSQPERASISQARQAVGAIPGVLRCQKHIPLSLRLVLQEAQRRLRPVRLKVELFMDTGSNGEGSGHGNSAAAAAASAESAADATNGAGVVTGGAPQAALQQALSHTSGGSAGGNSTGSQAPIPSSASEGSMLSRHVPGLRHITNRLPTGPLPRVHLRHAVSRANPFRAVRSHTRHAEQSSNSELTVMYEVRTDWGSTASRT